MGLEKKFWVSGVLGSLIVAAMAATTVEGFPAWVWPGSPTRNQSTWNPDCGTDVS